MKSESPQPRRSSHCRRVFCGGVSLLDRFISVSSFYSCAAVLPEQGHRGPSSPWLSLSVIPTRPWPRPSSTFP